MSKIKPGSRKQKEIFKKRALNKGKFTVFVRLDFILFKRKNKLPFSTTIFQSNYDMPFSNHVSFYDLER